MRRLQTAMAVVAMATGFVSAASAACQLQQTAEYKVLMDGSRALVDGEINAKPVWLAVDTGSSSTLLFPEAVEAMGLKPVELEELKAYGAVSRSQRTAIDEFRFGGRAAHNIDLLINGRAPRSQRYAGLMGEDLLGRDDLELDFANGVVRLFRPGNCVGDQVAYWAGRYDVTPLASVQSPGKVEVYVTLNGQRILAEIDSSAPTSIVNTGAAQVAGVTPQWNGVRDIGPSRGRRPMLVQTFIAVFPTLTIGDETIKNAKLGIADLFAADADVPPGSRRPPTSRKCCWALTSSAPTASMSPAARARSISLTTADRSSRLRDRAWKRRRRPGRTEA